MTKARNYLNRETLLKLYNAFVFPYLTYCVEVWGTAPKKYLDPLIKIQKKIVRIITFSPYLCHTDPIFKDLPATNFQGRQTGGGWGVSTPPEFWMGGLNTSQPPLILRKKILRGIGDPLKLI